ncbi:hypothetical protein TrVFT333_002320 [Trichoderma virens FT-333]|nr:hypothetical protein TrVFT333_002320 [Trichoderma virens FT-333]
MQLGIFNIASIAFFAVPSFASMLEVFHGASCDEEPTGITQMLYASHAGYTFCGTAEDYGVNLVVRSGEEPDNPDWPYCEWSFFSDPFCEDLIVSLNPEGHTCACALLPAFKTFKIDCYGEPWKRRRRQRQRRNATIPYLSEPSYAMNQSLTPAQAWGTPATGQ